MPKPRTHPHDAKMTALRISPAELAIIARIRAAHPYLKGQAGAINLALHFWNQHNPEQPAEQQPRRDIHISRD